MVPVSSRAAARYRQRAAGARGPTNLTSANGASRALWPWHLPLLSVAYVARQLVDDFIEPVAVVRPVLFALGVAIVLLVLSFVVVRDIQRAGLLATLALLAVVRPEPIILVVVLFAAVIIHKWPRRTSGTRLATIQTVSRVANATGGIAALAAAIAVATGPSLGTWASDALTPEAARASTTSTDPVPDIYVLMLDGYPGNDTLRTIFEHDAEPFYASLEARGFDVYRESRSNYTGTNLTLASMFAMKPLDAVPGLQLVGDEHADDAALARAVTRAEGLATLRAIGYETTAIHPGYEHIAIHGTHHLEQGGTLRKFEIEMLAPTLIGRALDTLHPDWVRDQFRTWAERAFAFTPRSQRETGRPQFTFVHVVAPHPPIVFGPGAGSGPVSDLREFDRWPARDDPASMAAFLGQVEEVNRRVLDTVDRVRRDLDPDPIMIVMSDHGVDTAGMTGYWQFVDPRERVENLLAAATPGAPASFGPSPTPVNLLPRLLNRYAGARLPLSADVAYAWTGDGFEVLD